MILFKSVNRTDEVHGPHFLLVLLNSSNIETIHERLNQVFGTETEAIFLFSRLLLFEDSMRVVILWPSNKCELATILFIVVVSEAFKTPSASVILADAVLEDVVVFQGEAMDGVLVGALPADVLQVEVDHLLPLLVEIDDGGEDGHGHGERARTEPYHILECIARVTLVSQSGGAKNLLDRQFLTQARVILFGQIFIDFGDSEVGHDIYVFGHRIRLVDVDTGTPFARNASHTAVTIRGYHFE